ncbi:MAG: ATP-dependent DNA helicase PcrA [Parcubacteria group bacterium ADurb.Bin159]|nr:MAG: ATP-dependent DNA helicase PcrA [Parcubacteria group bacterium ADurb.Bin159]
MNNDKILANLNPEQKEAVTYGDGPFLIIAGAGTGKTTVITRRLVWLILEKKVKPDEILAVTFTEKAAREMEGRVDQLLPYGYLDLWVSTFHSFCERVLRENALDIGLSTDFKLLDEAGQSLFIRRNFSRFNLDYYRPLGNPFRFIGSLVKHFSRAKDELVSPEEYLDYVKNLELNKDSALSDELVNDEIRKLKEVAGAYNIYQKLLEEEGALDFGDLINYTIKLFKERPAILKKYQNQFKYILVDEFQDTNLAQYELLKILAKPKNNLTVVADDDQAVFLWRGASYNNVFQFSEDYPTAKIVALTKNYRSYQNILDLSYKFIKQNNPNRLEVQIPKMKNGSSLEKIISKHLRSVRTGEGIIEVIKANTHEEEVETIVKKIAEIKNKDKSLTWNDFAILARANKSLEPFSKTLEYASIPYQFLAHSGLFSKSIILDILSYLKLLDDYHESSSVYRLLISPIFKDALTNDDLVLLTHESRKRAWSFYQTLTQAASLGAISQKGLLAINKFLSWIEKHSTQSRREPVSKIIYQFLKESGYASFLTKESDGGNIRAQEDINYANQFLRRVMQFEKENPDCTIKSFIESINQIEQAGDFGAISTEIEGPESVKLLTVHGAKGLEFKYVFIVDLVDRRFPTPERGDIIPLPDALIKGIVPEGDTHLEEERRLFYVALTRAKDGLFLCWAEDYGTKSLKKPSRFLYELGLETKEKTSLKKESPKIIIPSSVNIFPVKKQKNQNLFLNKKISFTQLADFDFCPLQYKYKYILTIPTAGRPNYSFGRSIHDTLAKFGNLYLRSFEKQSSLFPQNKKEKKMPIKLEDLFRFYKESWVDEWYDSPEQKEAYREKGKEILSKFYKDFAKNPSEIMAVEQTFTFPLEEFIFKGRIDRIDKIKDGFEIIDYKTSKRKESNLTSVKEQLLIYYLALSSPLSHFKPIKKLTCYYLDGGEKVSFEIKEEEINPFKEKIIGRIKELLKSDFSATPGYQCQFCDYNHICPYREKA